MKKNNKINLPVNHSDFVNEAKRIISQKLDQSNRRDFLKRGITLGGLSMLTGCDYRSDFDMDASLNTISRLNDRVQGWLFSGQRLAPEYSESEITRPFPFNAFYSEESVPLIQEENYKLEVHGLASDKRSWALHELYMLQQHEQITRHICVEGWSAIGRWGGVRLSNFLLRIGADRSAKYISFRCADDYYTSIDMASALHPQTILAFTWDGHTLPAKYGYPLKLRIPTKLGYKNPKHIVSLEITNKFTGGYWEDQGYNWFGGS